jgi:aminotransferase in exopolysaccharide biosynthesis
MNNFGGSEGFVQEVIQSITSVIGRNSIALHEPEFDGNELDYVKECIDSNFVSSVGKFVNKFERDLEAYTGAKHAIAVSNGTSALHISLLLAGVERGDEVLIPSLTFIATANAVIYCGADPHFVDSEQNSLGIDPEKLRTYLESSTTLIAGQCRNRISGKVIRAMVPMHTFGHPSRIQELLEICNEFNITMVEDAAESLGSFYSNKHTGTFGLLGALSFNGNKTITTGGGGAILTNDSNLATRAKHITTTAKVPHKWRYVHDAVGFNYRLPNLNAALGCAQLERIESKISRKRKLFELYQAGFSNLQGVSLLKEPKDSRSNYWLQAIILQPEFSPLRNEILDQTNELGISTRPVWDLLTSLEHLSRFPCMDVTQAEEVAKSLINLPSSPQLVKVQK